MEKKKIIFSLHSLSMAGVEKLAFEYIDILKDYYDIALLINENHGEDNFFEKYIPNGVEYSFVLDDNVSEKILYLREVKNKNLFYKIWHSLYRALIYKKNLRENFSSYFEKNNYDLLVNFSLELPKEYSNNKSITWIQRNLEDFPKRKLEKIKNQLENTRVIVSISGSMVESIRKIFPNLINKVLLLYNFFDIEEITKKSIDQSELSPKELKLLNNKYILACSRLEKEKDYQTLLLAFKTFIEHKSASELDNKEDYFLYIIGEGTEKENILKSIKKLEIEDKVVFLGTLSNPYVWMKKSAVFVHTAKSEAFGRVIVEAMICGTAVIATDCSGPREIIEDGKYGILVNIGDYEKISMMIDKVISNKIFEKNITQNAQKRVEDFSKEKLKVKLIDIINDCVS